jgi:hypothetical protein
VEISPEVEVKFLGLVDGSVVVLTIFDHRVTETQSTIVLTGCVMSLCHNGVGCEG